MTIPKQLLEAKICNKNTCELQERIDKAIEYIEKLERIATFPSKSGIEVTHLFPRDVKKLLEILKGER